MTAGSDTTDTANGADVEAGDTSSDRAASSSRSGRDRHSATGMNPALLVQEGDIAADYLERLLDIVDYDGDIDLDVENDRAVVAIVGSGLHPLVGPEGETLNALQELTRLAVTQQTGIRSRLMLDVGGYRAEQRSRLRELATAAADKVVQTGTPVELAAMNPFERKVVHDVIAAAEGVRSESEGEEPDRRVVVRRDAG